MVDQERQQRLREARKTRAGLSDLEQWAVEQVARDQPVSDSTRAVADQAQARIAAEENREIQRVFGC